MILYLKFTEEKKIELLKINFANQYRYYFCRYKIIFN